VRVTTPIRGAVAGLETLGVRRISLLVPYLPETADLILGHFEEAGFLIDARATFGLDGDPQMNRVSRAALIEAAARVMAPASEALFISCTGLRTAGLPAVLEERLGRPILTSNGALAWHALRLGGVAETRPDQGALFAR
jgi:maleate isomerase